MTGKKVVFGLGGCGASAAQHLCDRFEPDDQFVIIDNSFADVGALQPRMSESGQFQALHLTSDMPDLRQIIFEGSDCDPRTQEGQLKLKRMSSWRVRPNANQFPLAMGAGQFRSLGAAVYEARLERIREVVVEAVTDTDTVFVISSTSGGTGSSLVTRVVDEVVEAVPSARVSVILVTNYPPFHAAAQQTTNTFATLLEILSMCHRLEDKDLEVHLVDASERNRESGWLDSLENWTTAVPRGIRASLTEIHESLNMAGNEVHRERGDELNRAWAWARSRPILEACGLSDKQVRRFMRGFVRALCESGVEFLFGTPQSGNSIRAKSPSGKSADLRLLRRVLHPNELLPVALESYFFDRLTPTLGQTGTEMIEEWADEPFPILGPSFPVVPTEDAVGYSAHYLGSVETQLKSDDGSVDVSRLVRRQLSLTREFLTIPYDGSEGLAENGTPHPADVLFRDIASVYESVLVDLSNELESLHFESKDNSVHVGRDSASAVLETLHPLPDFRRRQWLPSSMRSTKPYWFLRYAVPAVLAVVSGTLFIVAMGSSSGNRQSLSDSATVVAGLMGGLAVCLGAIALISSIQNSSITTLRTDKLFSSCVGVIEGVDMFGVAIEKARLTPAHAATPTDVWSHPSVQIAVEILNRRLSACLDDGLFGLLQFRDRERGVSTPRLNESLALKVFVLMDDLARVATSERKLTATPATAENILVLARDIRDEIKALSYRDMARSLRGN